MAMQEVDWDVLSYPPYSPNLPPSDNNFFRSNTLQEISFKGADELQKLF